MSSQRFPTKLKKEPLVEALFEMRFSTSAPVSNILPGMLITTCGLAKQVERLPAAALPEPVRLSDPSFKFLPLVRLQSDRFIYLIGDSSVAIACKLPYPGWSLFKPEISRVVKVVTDMGIIDSVNRFSLKYINIIEGQDIAENMKRVNLTLKIGDHNVNTDPFTLRTEITRDNITSIVQFAAPSTVSLATGNTVNGIVIDLDIISNMPSGDVQCFIISLPDNIESLHSRLKEIFFRWCLTLDTLQYLEPVYE